MRFLISSVEELKSLKYTTLLLMAIGVAVLTGLLFWCYQVDAYWGALLVGIVFTLSIFSGWVTYSEGLTEYAMALEATAFLAVIAAIYWQMHILEAGCGVALTVLVLILLAGISQVQELAVTISNYQRAVSYERNGPYVYYDSDWQPGLSMYTALLIPEKDIDMPGNVADKDKFRYLIHSHQSHWMHFLPEHRGCRVSITLRNILNSDLTSALALNDLVRVEILASVEVNPASRASSPAEAIA